MEKLKNMKISDSRTVQQIIDDFREKFPNLKLEFYASHHKKGQGSPQKEEYSHRTKLSEIRTIHDQGELYIDEAMSVDQLESEFYEKFGLNVQVFRRSGEIWLQTISTDSWSLQRQDEKGNESRKSNEY
jgi:hypothetical protein